MLFSSDYINDTKGIFKGWTSRAERISTWESLLPELDTQTFFTTDPAYSDFFKFGGETMARLGNESVWSGVGNVVAQVAKAYGYFQSAVTFVKSLYTGIIQLIESAMDIASDAMDTIEMAVNSIAVIPIVGWIIKILYTVAKLIFSIVKAIQKKGIQNNQKKLDEMAASYGLPMASWTPEADTLMGRELQRRVGPGQLDAEWAFSPRYPATSASDFVAHYQKVKQSSKCSSAWLVWSNEFSDQSNTEAFPGLGYIPGTMNLHGALSLTTAGLYSIKDYGDFFPVTRSIAAQLWSQTVSGSSGLTFAIETDKLINRWQSYVESAYGYGSDYIAGWTRVSGPINRSMPLRAHDIPGLIYNCSSCDSGKPNCGKKDRGKKDAWRTPLGTGARTQYLQYLKETFGWRGPGEVGGSPRLSDWMETMAPVTALRNLRERQEAMIMSPKCMYLDDSTSAGGVSSPRYRAIRKGTQLHKMWIDSVTAIFESGDWKKIDYRDVIPGEDVDQAIRTMLSNRRTTPEKFFNLNSRATVARGRQSLGIATKKYASVLGDPVPPPPPAPIQGPPSMVGGLRLSPEVAEGIRVAAPIRMRTDTSKVSGGGSSTSSSSMAPIALAAALGMMLTRGRK